MSSAALEMLKNGSMAKEPEPMAETEEVDIDKLKTHAQINKVVADYSLTVPDNWGEMTVPQKKQYLNETYGDEGDDEDPQKPDPMDTLTVEEVDSNVVAAPEEQADEAAVEEAQDEPTAGASLKNLMAEAEAAGAVEEINEILAEADAIINDEPAPAEKPKAKKSGKAKAADIDAAATAPEEVTDFSNIVTAIENMGREASLKAVEELSEQSGYAMFKQGGLFARIKSQGWYDPFDSFEEWVAQVHGMAKRKAQYSIAIYENLVNSEIPFEKVKGLKWSKLKEIAPIMTKETADEWIEKAQTMNVSNLIEEVKAHKKAMAAAITGEQADGAELVKKVITRSFKLYEDQAEVVETAIDRAKHDTGADENNQALEAICLSYLAGDKKITVGKQTLADAIKEAGFEKAIELVAEMFPEHDITIG